MRKFLLVATVFLAACNQSPSEPADLPPGEILTEGQITLQAKALDSDRVEFVVNTDIPTPIEVMASVDLANQAPDDVYIGYTKRVTLEKSSESFVLNTSEASDPLSSGDYVAQVSFYKRWGAENGNPAASQVKDVSASVPLTLGGSGEDAVTAKERNDKQRWLMGTFAMNDPWRPAYYEQHLGPSEKFPSTMSRLHDAYYYPEADITLLVNRVRSEATVYRLGRKSE